jgi:Iap family predicted aminopeptidase
METIDAKFAFKCMKAISFERRAGTTEQDRAARLISGFLKEIGVSSRLEPFTHDIFSVGTARLEITAPFKKNYDAWPVGYGAPASNIAADIAYVENPTPASMRKTRGKAVMLDGGVFAKDYNAALDAGVKALVLVNSPGRKTYFKFSYMPSRRRKIPAVTVSYETALDIIRRKGSLCRISSATKTGKSKSFNVVAEIRGREFPNEIILAGGHYDSVPWSPGAVDNAGGSALALALAKRFAARPPRRTVRFVWFAAEELGLLGSWEYVSRHSGELKNIKLMFNLDVGGNLIGRINPCVTGGEKLAAYAEALARETGACTDAPQSIVSSDSVPFAERGIQSVNFLRGGSGAGFTHTEKDAIVNCGPTAFEFIGAYSAEFLRRVADAVEFPFPGGIPEKLRNDLKAYIVDRSGRKFNYRENV